MIRYIVRLWNPERRVYLECGGYGESILRFNYYLDSKFKFEDDFIHLKGAEKSYKIYNEDIVDYRLENEELVIVVR